MGAMYGAAIFVSLVLFGERVIRLVMWWRALRCR